ncbi:MAG: hypothetical protein ACE5HO_21435, partial [bacterium]
LTVIYLRFHDPVSPVSRKNLEGTYSFRIGLGKAGVYLTGIVGFAATALAIFMSLLPSDSSIGWIYPLKSIGGSVFMIVLGLAFYFRFKSVRKKA